MGFSKLLHRFSKTSHHGEDDTSLGQAKDSRTPHTVLAIPADAIVSRRGNTPGLPSGINQEAPDTEVALSAATTPLLLVTPAETSVLEKSSGSPPSTVPVESPELSENAASLWSRAYVALQSEDAKLVDEYEKLLSRELLQQALPGNLQHNTSQIGNQIDNVDPDKRQQQLKSIMDRGLQKIDEKQTKYTIFGTEFVLRDQISQTVNLVQSMKGVIDEAVKGSPEASLAWAGVSVLLPILTNPSAAAEANRDGLTYVTSRIRYYVELETLLWPRNLNNSELKGEFDTHITDLYQHILKFQIQSVLRFYRKWILNIGRDVIRYDEWEKMVSKIKELEQIVKDESSALNTISSRETLEAANKQAGRHYAEMQSLLSVTKEILQVSQDHRDISSEHLAVHKRTNQILEDRPIDLPTVNEARYDSADVQDSPKCESGTRLGILKRIHQWIDEPSAEPLFWLVGPAGTGKSTIARTVADFLYENNRLAAGYFFKRGEKGRNDTARFFPTIAMQLVDTIPHFKNSLRKSLDGSDKTTVEGQGLKFQFEKLLLHPLVDISSEQSGISTKVIIIDAMDECERPEHLSQVLNLFCQLQSVSSVRLRVLLTSRSAPEIVNTFEELRKNKDFRSLELLQREFSKETQVDIHTFLEKRFKEIRLKRKVKQDPWPAPEDFSRLLQLATNPEPLFIYAATLCRFVYDEKRPKNPKKQLELWLKQCDGNQSQLSQIYEPVLNQVFLGNEEGESERQLQFLASLVLLADPLPATSLASLLGMDIDDVQWWLQELHAVLDNPSDEKMPLRLLHKSFSDFLIGQEGPGANRYGIDPGNIHAMLTLRCIQRMRLGLRRDICGIKSTGKAKDEIDERVIESRIPADLKYACCYWIHHLQHSGPMDNAVSIFLTEHFLHWIEALSLLGRLSDGGIAIKRLLKTLQSVPDTSLELIDLVKDTSRFISTFGPIIGRVPLQVYAASLLFSPISSKVRLRYWHEQLPRIAGIHGVKEDWDMNQQTLEGHNDWVRDVTFSPDSQLIASASYDGTVRLWDSTTSGHRGTLKGHGYPVKGVAFSPDGKLIATASYDSTVKLWDMNGVCRHTLEGHTSSVNAVVFSPDSQLVLSASGDKTVHIWSTNGIHQKTIEGHDKAVTAIAVSPDGKLIASGSIDKTVRLWDMEGNHRHTFEGYPAPVSSVAFSPDGTLLASGSGDRMVRLCELDGTNLRRLEGHGGSANTVKFSPDGSLLASGSTDRCIRLWDVASGFHVSTIQGHTDSINSVAFSPDGQLLASAANDGSVRVWYMYRDTYQPTVEGHNDKINVLTLSADRKLLVSASEDGTVRLGDALDNTHLQMFTGHQGPVLTVALSPDGLFLATSSADYTLNVWDITRGEFLYSLRVGNWMRAIAFSPDNKLLASGSDDGIFQIWDIMTGAAHSYFKDEEYVVRAISFSNDTRLLVSAAEEMGERPEERVLRIWDTKTGAPTWTIQSGKQSSIGAVAFSNDDRLVAAASETEIRLWDVTERVQYATLNIGSVRSLVFDPKIETRLHTDLGTFDLFKPVQLDMVPYSESLEYNAAFGGLRLSSDRTWIMKGGEKIIWLPPDYRPTASAVRESTIYIGCASGRIVWFEDGELY